MPQVKIYNTEKKEVDKMDLSENIFGLGKNDDLVYQAAVTQMANMRQVLAHTKDRGEVRGGGRKPWKQKGTGRARHGSTRSPLWSGGGVTFGPTKERNFKKKINKKMKRKALFVVLSDKLRENDLMVLDNLKIDQPKTKKMIEIFYTLFGDKRKSILVVLPDKRSAVAKSIKNIIDTKVLALNNLNIIDLLNYKYLLMPREAVESMQKVYIPLEISDKKA